MKNEGMQRYPSSDRNGWQCRQKGYGMTGKEEVDPFVKDFFRWR
jgi:hypothetical protein